MAQRFGTGRLTLVQPHSKHLIRSASSLNRFKVTSCDADLPCCCVMRRAEKLSKTFKHSFLLANSSCCKDTTEAACRSASQLFALGVGRPSTLHPGYTRLLCQSRFLGKLSIICYPHSNSLCQRAMDLFHTLAIPQNELKSQVDRCFCWLHLSRDAAQFSQIAANAQSLTGLNRTLHASPQI